jgi:hypothetical protein
MLGVMTDRLARHLTFGDGPDIIPRVGVGEKRNG